MKYKEITRGSSDYQKSIISTLVSQESCGKIVPRGFVKSSKPTGVYLDNETINGMLHNGRGYGIVIVDNNTQENQRVIAYPRKGQDGKLSEFLKGLTIPDEDMWVGGLRFYRQELESSELVQSICSAESSDYRGSHGYNNVRLEKGHVLCDLVLDEKRALSLKLLANPIYGAQVLKDTLEMYDMLKNDGKNLDYFIETN